MYMTNVNLVTKNSLHTALKSNKRGLVRSLCGQKSFRAPTLVHQHQVMISFHNNSYTLQRFLTDDAKLGLQIFTVNVFN